MWRAMSSKRLQAKTVLNKKSDSPDVHRLDCIVNKPDTQLASDLASLAVVFRCPCRMLVYPPQGVLGPRRTTDWELIWALDGTFQWNLDGIPRTVAPGTILLRPPGHTETFTWDRVKQTRIAYFHFDLMVGGVPFVPPENWPKLIELPDHDIVRPLLRRLSHLHKPGSDIDNPLAIDTARLLVLTLVSGDTRATHEGSGRMPVPVEKALRYVHRLLSAEQTQEVTLAELAREAGVSTRHLVRLFDTALGQSPTRAVRILRLQTAATLIASTELRVREVAQKTGFASEFHFSRTFSTLYGVSPRQFRQRYKRSGQWPDSVIKLDFQLDGVAEVGR
jgi:AraC family transcriptional regulator